MTTEFKLELDNFKISKDYFNTLVEGVFVTISKDLTFNSISTNDIVNLVYDLNSSELTATECLSRLDNYDFDFKVAIALRAVVAGLTINISRNNKLADMRGVWKILYRTLNKDSGIPIKASLGSQGFLSIPLYSNGRDQNISELLRLHFWDKSLHEYPTYRKVNLFSIHSHQFHATSWILKGNITNSLFKVKPTDNKSEQDGYCFFNIEWDETKEYKSNLKKSFAVNSNKFVTVEKESTTTYFAGQSYDIICGDFHDSFVDLNSEQNAITSTLFLFDGTKGRIKKSEVIGPANIQKNEVIRENNIDSNSLIEKLHSQI
jgi:hypothetical protein